MNILLYSFEIPEFWGFDSGVTADSGLLGIDTASFVRFALQNEGSTFVRSVGGQSLKTQRYIP
jgi:hypothetical protein